MWSQLANAALAIWLMAAPSVLGYADVARTNDLIVGPIAASIAIIAISDVCRSLGKANLALGLWLVIAPWVLGFDNWSATINSSVAGACLSVLAIGAGHPQGRYGGGWSFLWKTNLPR